MRKKMTTVAEDPVLHSLLKSAASAQEPMVAFLRRLVVQESPTGDKAAVDACVTLVAAACKDLGAKVRLRRQKKFGDLLEVRFGWSAKRRTAGLRPLLLLGHLDTVWPMGTLKAMPFRIADGRIWGPGVLDMKAGVAMALTAVRLAQDVRHESLLGARPVILLLNSEEEVGSPVSRVVTEEIAGECEAVFVLEPGQGLGGAYKTARKGTGDYIVRVDGVAAHAGVDFGNGHSAVVELARQIGMVSGFSEIDRGITVNPGVIRGGTQANVVAAEAWMHVDFRYVRATDAKKIERKFRQLRPIDRQCSIHVTGGVNRPPMERTTGTVALFRRAATLAAGLGFELQEASTGGGSDGNFTSAIGVPTLDGMGAVGEGAHAGNESILIEQLVPRTALLAAMILKV